MPDQLRRFEVTILRPLQIVFLLSTALLLIKGMWWWLAGCIGCLFYLGIVGSKLHPLQSTTDLVEGPIEGPAAHIESEVLPVELRQMLVGHACTRTGILFGVAGGVISWVALGLAWYFTLAVASFATLLAGGLLKVAFRPE